MRDSKIALDTAIQRAYLAMQLEQIATISEFGQPIGAMLRHIATLIRDSVPAEPAELGPGCHIDHHPQCTGTGCIRRTTP